MRQTTATVLTVFVLALGLFAVEKQYRDATILKIEQKTNTRVIYTIVNTPITKEDPYYEVSLRLGDVVYLARYTPRHADDALPGDWSAGSAIQLRVSGRRVFVKRPGGGEMQLVVVKRTPVPASERDPQPASAEK